MRILLIWLAVSIPAALYVGKFIAHGEEGPPAPRRHPRALAAVLFVACLLAACNGGGRDAALAAVAPVVPVASAPTPPVTPPVAPTPPPQTTCPVGETGTPPTCATLAPPTATTQQCPQGTTLPPLACSCPPVDLGDDGSCISPLPPVATVPPCPVGTSLNYPGVCSCPPNDVHTFNCTVPANTPAPTMSLSYCPGVDYTAAGNVCTSPGGTLEPGDSAILLWTSAGTTGCYGAAGWPTSDLLSASGFVSTGVLTQAASYSLVCQGGGGNATASVTVAVSTPTAPAPPGNPTPPIPTPTFAIVITADPPALVDSAGCPSDYNGTPCLSTISLADSIGEASQDVCSMNNGTPQPGDHGWIVGPFGDGPQVLNFSCTNVFSQTATAAITLSVSPPFIPPVDAFTVAGSDPYTFAWATTSAQGAGGCSVELFNSQGVETTLSTGGTLAGSATSGFLSGAYSPWTATLYCSGAPDVGVPSLTVNP